MRPAPARHRPGRRGDHERLHVHGLGFVAIATLIFGKWNPWGILGAGILFGFAQTLSYYVSGTAIPQEVMSMVPYLTTILVIILTSGKQVGPKASGEIYDPSKR